MSPRGVTSVKRFGSDLLRLRGIQHQHFGQFLGSDSPIQQGRRTKYPYIFNELHDVVEIFIGENILHSIFIGFTSSQKTFKNDDFM